MSGISEVVLFWSEFSKHSIECKKYIKSINMPVRFLKVDSPSVRQRVTNGENFNIKVVPSLMVVKSSGVVNVYQGKVKIKKWIHTIMESRKPENPINARESRIENRAENRMSVDEKLIFHPQGSKQRVSPQQESTPIESNIELLGEPEQFEGTELIFSEEPEEQTPPPKMPTKGFSTGPPPKKTNDHIKSSVAKMMAERDKTLGYGSEKHG
jgi:hypothetical protein